MRIKGYTLTELVIVVGLVVGLGGLGGWMVNNKNMAIRDENRKVDLYNTRMGLEQYYVKEKEYPESLEWGGVLALNDETVLLEKVGVDPKEREGFGYVYELVGQEDYRLCARMELSKKEGLWCLNGAQPRGEVVEGLLLPTSTPFPSPTPNPGGDFYKCRHEGLCVVCDEGDRGCIYVNLKDCEVACSGGPWTCLGDKICIWVPGSKLGCDNLWTCKSDCGGLK